MELNRKHLSLLITVLSMSLVVLLLYNIHLGKEQEEEYIVELTMDEFFEEEIPEPKESLPSEKIKSHLAFNETMKPSVGNPEPLKTLEEILAEKNQNPTTEEGANENQSQEDGYAASLKELRKKRKKTQQKYGKKTAETLEKMNTVNKNTSISYSLVDRRYHYLPIPIYTCPVGGKIVVNIKVSKEGTVLEASINEKSSSTLNGCLVDNAIKYAYKSSFNNGNKNEQIGSITYLFQGK